MEFFSQTMFTELFPENQWCCQGGGGIINLNSASLIYSHSAIY